jgi:response regulator NasT
METRRLTEQEAYRRLRRMAMDRGIRLAEAAKMVLNEI